MPHTSPVPTRRTSEADLNRYNVYLRSLPWYQQFFTQRGLDANRVRLSRGQQSELERLMSRNGMRVPSGMHIDQAGNLNQKNRLARNVGIGAAVTGGALTGFGLAGLGPLSGLGGAAATGIPTLASTPIGTGLGFGPASLAGTSALGGGGVGAGLGAAAAGAGGGLASRIGNGASPAAGGLTNRLLGAGFAGLAGLSGLVGNRNPTAEEQALQQQVLRLLAQQEARTSAQDPLFQDVTALTRSLLPQRR